MKRVFMLVIACCILSGSWGMAGDVQQARAAAPETAWEIWDSVKESFGAASHMPIFYADGGIIIDGQLDDWKGYSGISLPANNEQVQMKEWAGDDDLSLHAWFAYDEEHFYLAAKVTDNVHQPVAGEFMWMGDSLQLAFGDNGVYGPEYGFNLIDGEAQVWRWVEGQAALDKSSIALQAVQSGKDTVYEAAIPWEAIFSGKPGNKPFQFSLLVNDNDGSGRRGWLEWNESIGRVKDANKMSTLYPVPLHDEWSFWLDTRQEVQPGEKVPYTLTAVNFSQILKTLTFDSEFLGLHQKADVPPGGVVHLSSSYSTADSGEFSADVEVAEALTGVSRTLSLPIVVVISEEDLDARLASLGSQLPVLEDLLLQAESQGLSTDYERVDYTVLRDFIGYAREDAAHGRLQRAIYVLNELEATYSQSVSSLEAYLAGSREPLSAPRYTTGPLNLEGYGFAGTTMERSSGEVEENRPIFLNGYGHFDQVRSDLPKFQDLGANIVQVEIGPARMLLPKEGNIPKFSSGKSGNVSGEVYVDGTVSRSGSKSLKMVNRTPKAPNVYLRVWQGLTLKANTTYTFKAWVKADGLQGQNAWFPGGPGWSLRTKFPAGTYDWTEITATYTTGSSDITTKMSFLLENTGTIWIDDIEVTKEGSTENLVKNNGFEEFPDVVPVPGKDYLITTERLEKDVLSTLQNGEEHNIAVNLLISPHYFPGWVLQQYPEVRNDGNKGFLKFNIAHPKAREVIETYLRALIPLVKDYRSLHSITLSNEPVYHANLNPAHLPDWHQYLSGLYGSIAELNRIYGTQYASFEEVAMPPVLGADPVSYDYMVFNSRLLIEWHQWMADIIHEMAPDLPVHVKIMTDFGPGLERGTDIEQFSRLSQINGNDTYNLLGNRPNSFRHEALIYDLQRSFNKAPVFNSEHHFIQDGDTNYGPDQAIHAKALFWQGAIHGRGASTAWVWERTYDASSVFEGSLLHRPDVVAGIGKTNLDLNRLAYEVRALQDAPSQTAILYSLPSGLYNSNYFSAMYRSYEALSYAGQNIRFVSEGQIAEGGLSRYSVLVIPAATHVPEAVLSEIRSFAEQGGKVVMLDDRSLSRNKHNEPLSAADREAVADRSVIMDANATAQQIRQTVLPLLEQAGLAPVLVKDEGSGGLSYGVEWRSVTYNGRILVNAINFSSQPKTVSLEVYGQPAQTPVKERISESMLDGSSITLEPWIPYLLELPIPGDSELPSGIKFAVENRNILVDWTNPKAPGYTHIELYLQGSNHVAETVKIDKSFNHYTFSNLSSGTYTVRVVAVDAASNRHDIHTSGELIIMDDAPLPLPVPMLDGPAHLKTRSGIFTITGTAEFCISCSVHVSIYDSHKKLLEELVAAIWSVQDNKFSVTSATDRPNGKYLIIARVKADDATGPESAVKMITVAKSDPGPVITDPDPNPNPDPVSPVNPIDPVDSVDPGSAVTDKAVIKKLEAELAAALLKEGVDTAVTSAAKAMTRFRAVSDLFAVTLPSKVSKPVKVELPYAGNGVNSGLLGIYRFNEAARLWTYVGGKSTADKKSLRLQLAEEGIYAVMEYDRSFRDVPTAHWANRTLKELAARHVIKGVNDTEFNPNGLVTRAEFASLLVRAVELPTEGLPNVHPFRDVSADRWYASDIAAVHAAGIVEGVAEGIFAPMQTITREQMAVMLIRAMPAAALQDGQNGAAAWVKFLDYGQVSSWAAEAVQAAASQGLMQGRGSNLFAPQATASRVEAATVIYHLLQYR